MATADANLVCSLCDQFDYAYSYYLYNPDGQYLVKRSIDLGKPILVVGINYRLGALGFFTSSELRQEARTRGETGYSNLGFVDQRLALEWVRGVNPIDTC
jgi:carboxylesterase type B